MPLVEKALSLEVQGIWKLYSYNAIQNMHVVSFPDSISISSMQVLSSQKFGAIFSGISLQLATAINSSLMTGIVSTPYGVSPPIPINFVDLGAKWTPIFYKWATKAFLDMNTLSFSDSLKIEDMFSLTSNYFGTVFSQISTEFATELVKSLTTSGFIGLVPSTIALKLVPIIKKWATNAILECQNVSYSDTISIEDSQKLVSLKFSEIFSGISSDFAEIIINTFKSSRVVVPLGIGNIS